MHDGNSVVSLLTTHADMEVLQSRIPVASLQVQMIGFTDINLTIASDLDLLGAASLDSVAKGRSVYPPRQPWKATPTYCSCKFSSPV